jgi:solute carrier family 13 (sodium-dependent dicarboxylate transporter), member 2/3/5
MTHAPRAHTLADTARWIGLALGPILAVLLWLFLPAASAADPDGFSHAARATAAVAALMAIWWLTEAIPHSATSLLPLVLFPLLGVLPFNQAAAPYANEIIFLFMGGFILGLALERWGLHKRIALLTVLLVGTGPRRLIGGFMLASALVSMWVSNTATAIMMLPIALSVIALVRERHHPPGTPEEHRHSPDANFESALVLGIAYAVSIGGVGTLIGTPPNAVFKGYVENTLHQTVSFTGWMKVGVPLIAVFLPLAWFYLTCISQPVRLKTIPGGREMIRGELQTLGPITRGEVIVLLVFALTIVLWIFRPAILAIGIKHGLLTKDSFNDATIGLFGALLLFIIPVKPREHVFAMDWATAKRLPWGALIFFGGGLSLAAAITASGLDASIGRACGHLDGLPVWLMVLIITAIIVFASELASNTAVVTAVIPILAAAAPALGVEPVRLLLPATFAASMAFMLPVGTPPNALVFATGHASMKNMVRTGFGLNIASIVLITAASEMFWNHVIEARPIP